MSEFNVKQPLNWFWIFYRFDKINEIIDEKKFFQQKLKFCLQMSILSLSLIQNTILYFGNNENFLFKLLIQFDILNHLGTGHQIAYLGYILSILFTIALALLLNQSNSSHYKWFEIIEVLNECKHFHRIGLNDYKFVDKYLNSIRKVKRIIEVLSLLIFIFVNLMVMILVLINFNLKSPHIWLTTIVWQLLFFSSVIPNITDISVSFTFILFIKIARLE